MGTNLISNRAENVANVEVLPVANANTQLETGNIGTGNTIIMATLENSLRLCVENNDNRFDFVAPDGAVACEDWRAFGAFEDWFYLTDGKWSFRLGSKILEASCFA
jgi:hypothetical protein